MESTSRAAVCYIKTTGDESGFKRSLIYPESTKHTNRGNQQQPQQSRSAACAIHLLGLPNRASSRYFQERSTTVAFILKFFPYRIDNLLNISSVRVCSNFRHFSRSHKAICEIWLVRSLSDARFDWSVGKIIVESKYWENLFGSRS